MSIFLTDFNHLLAGTIGTIATAPAIFTVGLIVGGAAVTLEVICALNFHLQKSQKVSCQLGAHN